MTRPRNGMNSRRGAGRLANALRYSAAGIGAAWRSEAAFRQEAAFAVVMFPGAFWLGRGPAEQLLLAGTVVLVLIVELLNTAIEYTLDRIGTDHHDLAGRAKDISSAAVLLSLGFTVLAWGTVAWARFAG